MAGSDQRSELEGARTTSEAKGEMVRLLKQMDALQRGAMKQEEYLDELQCEAREHDEYLDRIRGEYDEAEADKAEFQERLDDAAQD